MIRILAAAALALALTPMAQARPGNGHPLQFKHHASVTDVSSARRYHRHFQRRPRHHDGMGRHRFAGHGIGDPRSSGAAVGMDIATADRDGRWGAPIDRARETAPRRARTRYASLGPVERPAGPVRQVVRHIGSALQHVGGGMARVCAGSSCGTVAASVADKFRGLFADLVALGYNLGSPGCLSGGHMRNSLHHWGGACDLFNQVSRNRTALRQPPPHVQIELAAKHGLTSGCVWRNPDCGHFDLSGIGGGGHHVRRYARRWHGRRG